MSNNSDAENEIGVLAAFGKVRRQLNLKATQALKPMGIGPKQAVLMRELRDLGFASPIQLARQTRTDPASAGKILESLIRKKWVKRGENPKDRRSWQVSLTASGSKAVQKLDRTWKVLAEDFCGSLNARDREILSNLLTRISLHLDQVGGPSKDIS